MDEYTAAHWPQNQSINTEERFWIVSIDDPLFYGRLFRRLIENAPDRIAGVAVVPITAGPRRTIEEIKYRIRFWGLRAFVVMAIRRVRAQLGSHTLKAATERAGLPYVKTVTREQALRTVSESAANGVLASVPWIVPADAIAAKPQGWINVHCGPLPRYAGLDAPFWCLYHGEEELTVSVHYMAPSFDAGPLIGQCSIPNDGRPYAALVTDLFDKAHDILLSRLIEGTPRFDEAVPQDLSQRTYFGKPSEDLGYAFRRRGGRFV